MAQARARAKTATTRTRQASKHRSKVRARAGRGSGGGGRGIHSRLFIGVGVTLAVSGVLVAGVFVAGRLGDAGRAAPDASTEVIAPPVLLPVSQPAATPGALVGHAGEVDVAWATRMADATGISLRAIQSYAGVILASRAAGSTCDLGWNTLAAIGTIESGNGTYADSSVGADGRVTPPIIGIALDGDGVDRIADTDQGAIDGDPLWDRAVGPMQMIPETWRNWGTDASGDGVADPQNIDDASLATANYLCYVGEDLSVPANWKKAITSYNSASPYILSVSRAANRYAAEAQAAGG